MLFTSEYSVKMPLGQTILTALLGIVTVLAILAVIAVLIMAISKIVRAIESRINFEKNKLTDEIPFNPPQESQAEPKGTPLPETQSQGELTLIDVDEPTAAVVMALVSHKSGIPLNRLSFKSIKLLSEEETK